MNITTSIIYHYDLSHYFKYNIKFKYSDLPIIRMYIIYSMVLQ